MIPKEQIIPEPPNSSIALQARKYLLLAEIPRRPETAHSNLVDLTDFYNAATTESWYGRPLARNDLGTFTAGVQVLAGVKFDARGIVQVGRTSAAGFAYPRKVEGIRIGAKANRVHFLHACIYGGANTPFGAKIGEYTLHYSNGQTETIPIGFDRDLGDWNPGLSKWSHGIGIVEDFRSDVRRAWMGWNEISQKNSSEIFLYRMAWTNPHPELEIARLDLEVTESDDRAPAPFLVAITLEDAEDIQPEITSHPQSVEATVGEPVSFEIETASNSPMLYQWRFNGTSMPGATNAVLALSQVSSSSVGEYSVSIQSAKPRSVLSTESRVATLTVREGEMIRGGLKADFYLNIPGFTVMDLTNHVKFPDRPDKTEIFHQWDLPGERFDKDDFYGVRIHGFLIPPVTGEYTFYVSADDEALVFLSDNETPDRKRLIAHDLWNRPRVWFNNTRYLRANANISEPMPLEAGKRYFIESLYKEDSVGDHLQVTWQMPGQPPPRNGDPPIPGTYLGYPKAGSD